ncbi:MULTISPECIES: HNH endonuclease domain-containing protein [unclassified Adlercreutzia]|uniref:HNH endonuclease domain-containing protein n=1 Tax=unclassified Adlercreutzia TaxID=2636013 RepID=UPI0013EB8E0B|nr:MULTISPECIES: HNH endonuclease domain-containing protein [unclassified Adlercreutzia]
MTLLSRTENAAYAGLLEQMASNNTASYKLYFLNALVAEIASGANCIPLQRLSAKMVAGAWYPVVFFRLSFGKSDSLFDVVISVKERFGLSDNATEKEIVEAIESLDREDRLAKKVRSLLKYVPFRLVRPVYEKRLQEERGRRGKAIPDQEINGLIMSYMADGRLPAFYRLIGDNAVVDDDWASFIRDNASLIYGWLDSKLISFIQKKNPSVPAIPMKLHMPIKRDLSSARRYWEDAISGCRLKEVYSGAPLASASFDRWGQLSIDHFIPWSFVMHDEPWNLVPMFRNANSSKGARLPDLSKFFVPFCEQQLEAYVFTRNEGKHDKILESYLAIDDEMTNYDLSDRSKKSFGRSLRKAIVPLYQIALNQGYPLWDNSCTYEIISL